MWRNLSKNSRPGRARVSLSRWRLVVAIIFLFAGALVYKLFSLQIRECDLYTAMAASQQQVSSRLDPARGKIYFTEVADKQEKLYPIATNKEFAVLYAVPKDIVDPRSFAEKFYQFFDAPRLDQAKISKSTSSVDLSPLATSTASTAEDLVANYFKHFNKPGSAYDSLNNKKIDSSTLLKLFAFLASSTSSPVQADSLELKNYRVFYKAGASSSTKELKIPGLGFNLENFRYYPEKEIASHLLGFVSYADGEGKGKYGLEEFFNEELFGKYGYLKSEKGGQSNLMIVNDREYTKPTDGTDLVLTIDRNVEFMACQKLKEAVKQHGAAGGSVIALDPKTGAIIAMCSVPDFDPNNYKEVKDIGVYNNPVVFDQYEPGSVFKTVTMSIAIDQGKVTPATTYKDPGEMMINGWPKPIRNSDYSTFGPHGVVNMSTVLDYSLNTGAIFAMRQVGPKVFADYVKNYGFGERTGIELGAESTGDISTLLSKKVREIDSATASFGQGIAATPLQMIMPYQAIANQGIMMKPYVVKALIRGDQREEVLPKQIRKVISDKTAATISAMLVNVVENGHAKRAHIPGYYVGGKTGTAQVAVNGAYSKDKFIHTFVGIAPIDHPAFVMLTKIDSPKDVQYAEGSALPLWKDIADFMLKYYQIPKTRSN